MTSREMYDAASAALAAGRSAVGTTHLVHAVLIAALYWGWQMPWWGVFPMAMLWPAYQRAALAYGRALFREAEVKAAEETGAARARDAQRNVGRN